MTSQPTPQPSAGAMRAAQAVESYINLALCYNKSPDWGHAATIIDHEAGLPALLASNERLLAVCKELAEIVNAEALDPYNPQRGSAHPIEVTRARAAIAAAEETP